MADFVLIKFNQDMSDPFIAELCKPILEPRSIGWGFYQYYKYVHLDEDDKLIIVKKLPSRGNKHVNRSED